MSTRFRLLNKTPIDFTIKNKSVFDENLGISKHSYTKKTIMGFINKTKNEVDDSGGYMSRDYGISIKLEEQDYLDAFPDDTLDEYTRVTVGGLEFQASSKPELTMLQSIHRKFPRLVTIELVRITGAED